jgi:hypothetical protein
MISVVMALCLLVLVFFPIYDHLEISTLKYGLLKAIAAQSKAVDTALSEILYEKENNKILNKDYRKLEKLYISDLNLFLLRRFDEGCHSIRNEILSKKDFLL